ncbi:G patch domain-containing protein 1 [Amblyraja radiata]|uniref:G patch domain-containing protein 1 n=1 Tax=Amblyraja radiata TaxID=386614 RepID=UPI001402457A|nr:G patch domain-containing protein 1 [Amblyraja radiata]
MAEDEEEEDFTYFGSALEPLEEGQTTVKKPVPLQEQTVKDERGRYQRFHGAFTGGFSAGYFNSVGSKEGWAPSTFVSSRQQKADTQMFAPEHFMDEEDQEEHGIAPRGIMTRSSFASKATDAVQERARALASVAGPIPGASALGDLITLATVTVGVRLLRLMGWKEGQGLGPRVKRKAQRQYIEPAVRVYGCSLPDEELQQPQECEGEAYLPEGLTFAPRDVVPMDFTLKDDRHGLGYSGIDPRRALCGSASLDPDTLVPNPAHRLLEQAPVTGHTRPGITGQAFGVGALEEEDDDIYSRDSLSRYDSVLNEEEPGDGLYGWTAPTPTPRGRGRGACLQQGYVGKEMEGFTLRAATTKSITVPTPSLL